MNAMRRILGDRQVAGLLTGLVAYLMIAQAALAGAVCSMAPAPGESVICTTHGVEARGDSGHVHDCQCQIGCQHCAPAAIGAPEPAASAAGIDAVSIPAPAPTKADLRPAPATSAGGPRAPPLSSV